MILLGVQVELTWIIPKPPPPPLTPVKEKAGMECYRLQLRFGRESLIDRNMPTKTCDVVGHWSTKVEHTRVLVRA